ncbi:hypothetical protein CBR_g88332, partial [Chara braunii]
GVGYVNFAEKKMDERQALSLLGLKGRASRQEIRAAYLRRTWETHPDRFPAPKRAEAECMFKQVSTAYHILINGQRGSNAYASAGGRNWSAGGSAAAAAGSGGGAWGSASAASQAAGWTAGTRSRAGRRVAVMLPFLLITVGTVTLGANRLRRAYQIQRRDCPSRNPFLP